MLGCSVQLQAVYAPDDHTFAVHDTKTQHAHEDNGRERGLSNEAKEVSVYLLQSVVPHCLEERRSIYYPQRISTDLSFLGPDLDGQHC